MGGLSEAQAARGFARLLDRPALPYQGDLVDTLSARAEDGTAYAAQLQLVLAPRQVGKTLTIFTVNLARLHTRRGYAAAYTAQTGIVVSRVFANAGNGWLNLVTETPALNARFQSVRSAGREQIRHRGNRGAYVMAFPPTPGRLRSTSLDGIVLDECQEHTQEVGQSLLADAGPTQATRPRRQLILMGTAPESAAGWWAGLLARGRAGHVPLFEVGTWPDDADPESPDTWRAHHPGLRHGLTDEDYLRSQLESLGVERFAREFGNKIPGGASLDTPLTQALWEGAQYHGRPPAVPLLIAFDAAADGAAGTIGGLGRMPDGTSVFGIAAQGQGMAWMIPALTEMHRRHPRARIAADATGPAAAIVDALQRAGMEVDTVTGADRLTACGHLISELEAGRAFVLPHPAMENARQAAKRRWMDTGGWVWSRRRSKADISPLTAWTAALWAARTKDAPRPMARTGRNVGAHG